MTDLERALLQAYRDVWTEVLPNGPSHQVMFGIKIVPIVEAALAAARREGAEEAATQFHELEFISLNELKEAERRGAEEMRERAARLADGYVTDRTDDVAHAIRALPLTPEEP